MRYIYTCIYLLWYQSPQQLPRSLNVLHFLKLKYKESNLQDEPPCSNVTILQTGSLTCTWDVSPCTGEVGGGGDGGKGVHSLPPDTKDSTLF